jgi:hypothetical protein
MTAPTATMHGISAAPASGMARTEEPDAESQATTVPGDKREKFIPVTRHALIERLTRPHVWAPGQAAQARRFLRFLSYWRGQSYNKLLLELEQTYEPFSPDSDLLVTRHYTEAEKLKMQHRVVNEMADLLRKANYVQVDTSKVEAILTKESHYGLDLEIDLNAFDELLVFYRGATTRKSSKRTLRKLYLYKEEFEVPIFQRLFMLFKLKTVDARIEELMRERNLERAEAEKHVKKLRSILPSEVKSDYIYMKLFKNLPQTDLEMVFPNGKVKFRLFDKLKLGVSAGGGIGMGVFGTATKIAVATNPIALAGAVAGLGGIAARQAINFMNQRTKYMVTLAQNLYFHAMADNRGVMALLCDRAAEEDVKEEALLYSVLAKSRVHTSEMEHVDEAIEQYLVNSFGVDANFDVYDALERLKADRIVTEDAEGYLNALPPELAAEQIDVLWDAYLDELPDIAASEGEEMDVPMPASTEELQSPQSEASWAPTS